MRRLRYKAKQMLMPMIIVGILFSMFLGQAQPALADPIGCEDDLAGAILLANNTAEDDIITLAANCSFAISGELMVGNASTAGTLKIIGSGSAISGENSGRIFNITTGGDLTLEDVEVLNGRISDANGGAILNDGGTLTLINSRVADSSAIQGNASLGGLGGGIYIVDGTLIVTDSSIDGNNPSGVGLTGTRGGAIYVENSTVTLNGATISLNRAIRGAGIFVSGDSTVNIENSFFSDNDSNNGGAAIEGGTGITINNSTFYNNRNIGLNNGGAIATVDDLDITNTTIYNDNADDELLYVAGGETFVSNSILTGGARCITETNGTLLSGGHNLVGDANDARACPTGATGDAVVNGAINEIFEILPGDYGGPTQTMALELDGPAVDTGDCPETTTDQRGFPRPSGTDCDKGAFELQQTGLVFTAIALDFLEQIAGTTSGVKTIGVQNATGSDVNILSIALTAPGTPQFRILTGEPDDCTIGTLPDEALCEIRVVFEPTSGGNFEDFVRIESDAQSSPDEIFVFGTGLAPVVDLSTTSLAFDAQLAGSTSAAQTIIITNTGTSTLEIERALISINPENFSVLSGAPADCTTIIDIEPEAACDVRIVFNPQEAEDYIGRVRIDSNAATSPNQVDLTGSGSAPGITLSPPTLNFGTLAVNNTAIQTITLTSDGTEAVTLVNLVIFGGGDNYTLLSGLGMDCAISQVLDIDDTCNLRVQFNPQTTGTLNGTLRVTSNADSSPDDVPLTGIGSGPLLTLSENVLDFGTQKVNTVSAPQTVTITNNGNTALVVNSLLTFNVGGQFALAIPNAPEDCIDNINLGAGESCTFTVTFTPTTTGVKSGAIRITSNMPDSPLDLPLTGISTDSDLIVSTGQLNFGQQLVGTTSLTRTVTVSNVGGAGVNLNSIAVTTEGTQYSIQTGGGDDCAIGTLAASDSCEVRIVFNPISNGTKAGSLTITSSATSSPDTIALNGEGVSPGVVIEPDTVNFGAVPVSTTSEIITVTVGNNGTTAYNLTGFTINNGAGTFALLNGNPVDCVVGPVAPATSCELRLTFSPNNTGTFNGNLQITTNTPDSPFDVPLTGTGAAAALTLSTNTLNFGDQSVGTTSNPQMVTLTNTGTLNLNLTSISIITDNTFSIVSGGANDCVTSTLMPAQSCNVQVAFAPPSTGAFNGTLRITSNVASSPDDIVLTGTGTSDVVTNEQPTNLTVTGTLINAPVRPTLNWTHQTETTATSVPGDWYAIYLQQDNGTLILFEWFDANTICSGVTCSVSLTDLLPNWGLLNADYQWWVGAYLPDNSQVWSGGTNFAPATFTVAVPASNLPTNLTNDPRNGRPIIYWDDDGNTLWVQIFIGGGANTYLEWHERDGVGLSFSCNTGICALEPVIDWSADSNPYAVWMQAWSPGGFSSGSGISGADSWIEGDELNLPATAPPVPASITATPQNGNVTFMWGFAARATWYEIIIAPPDNAWSYPLWLLSYDIGCGDGGTCTWVDPVLANNALPAGNYTVKVRAWGPGGTSAYSPVVNFTIP